MSQAGFEPTTPAFERPRTPSTFIRNNCIIIEPKSKYLKKIVLIYRTLSQLSAGKFCADRTKSRRLRNFYRDLASSPNCKFAVREVGVKTGVGTARLCVKPVSGCVCPRTRATRDDNECNRETDSDFPSGPP